MEENDEEEKEPIHIELTKQKSDPYNDENAVDFKWPDEQEDEEDIALANFNQSLQKQTDEENLEKITGWLFDDCGIVSNENKN